MRYLQTIFILLFISSSISCIKPEALNAEADILSCLVNPDILKKDPIIQNERIQILVKSDTDLRDQAPLFELTDGATIQPESGTHRDFTDPQVYTVSSEDGLSKKVYEVAYIISALGSNYSFEHVRSENGKFDVFYEVDADGKTVMDWASGNSGFSLTGAASKAEDFPTARLADGKIGGGLKLTTRSTGKLGALIGKPMAAGNLFMGEFDVSSSIGNPLKSLHLGVPADFIPSAIIGYFKYESGPIFKDSGKENPNKTDTWDLYALFFETDEELKYLDGTNRFTHPNLVAIAKLDDEQRVETNEWTRFHVPFELVNNKQVDPQKLKEGKYSISLVLTSSVDGDNFNGAEGSTLLIDEIELIHADNE